MYLVVFYSSLLHYNFLNNVLHMVTDLIMLFSLKSSLFLVLVGLGEVWGGSKQIWTAVGDSCMCLAFLRISFILQPFSHPAILSSH